MLCAIFAIRVPRRLRSCGDKLHSTFAYLQTDADFSGLIVGEVNAGLLQGFLYLEDSGEVSFHDSLILFAQRG
jgi:hypothetical protein